MDPLPTDTHRTELRATIHEIEQGLTVLPLSKGVNRIDDWAREIDATERDDLRPIAADLRELHGALTGPGITGATIGPILVRLGERTEATATDTEAALAEALLRLGSLLRHAGHAMTGG
ncbi:MAG: hypothetical protein AAF791_06430 [Bacteroidota bacterium]